MSQLSDNMLCDPSNITRVAAILERKGLITRQRNEQDRRAVDLKLTPAGERLYREAVQAHEAYTRRRMAVLTAVEQETLTALLDKLIAGLRRELQNQASGA
jgi:DNA-binding MarR family transcriptional regulator